MLTATSPLLLRDERPYNVPLALGLLFSLDFVLFLFVGGFLVVDVVDGLGFGLAVLAGFGFTVVLLALVLVAFSLIALDSLVISFITISSLTTVFSSILFVSSNFSAIVAFSVFLSDVPPRAEFFFLFEVFLKF